MKIRFHCMECLDAEETINLPLSNNRRYEVTCKNGHTSTVLVLEDNLEYLFESGAYALLDGYARESVASFASSLERFYEFAVRVFLLKRGVRLAETEWTWKRVKLSERRLGGFMLLYLSEMGEAVPEAEWKALEEQVKLRNNIIHNGYIPTEKEALGYGEVCLSYMKAVGTRMAKTHADEMREVSRADIEAVHEGKHPIYHSGSTLLSIANICSSLPLADPVPATLTLWIEEQRKTGTQYPFIQSQVMS